VLARSIDGSATGWGWTSYGECAVPALPAGLAYIELAASLVLPTTGGHGLGLRSDGSLVAWGDNSFGQCAVPALPPGISYTHVASGSAHSLAVRSDGSVVAWGNNTSGECTVPPPPSGTSYVAVATGSAHSLGLLSDGTLQAWGDNSAGQCNLPGLLPGERYVEIAAGAAFSLARRNDGVVVAAGDNTLAQCNVPPLPAGMHYVEITAGEAYGLARRSDGLIAAWGDDLYGQCQVPALPEGYRCIAISAGSRNSVELLESLMNPFCSGDGSGLACPCANSGAAGRGCANSALASGALLAASGSPTLAADTLRISCAGMPAHSLGILLQGTGTIAPVLFGDGVRCVGGILKRIYVHNAIGGALELPQPGDLPVSARSAQLGDTITQGSTRNYQLYYRDPSASFCPAPQGSTFNVSNGLTVLWEP